MRSFTETFFFFGLGTAFLARTAVVFLTFVGAFAFGAALALAVAFFAVAVFFSTFISSSFFVDALLVFFEVDFSKLSFPIKNPFEILKY